MQNQPASATSHEDACARVAALFPKRWLHHYVGGKLRSDGIFRAAYELLRGSDQPLLDVGCGVGLLPFYLRERCCAQPITGLDIDARKLRHAVRAVEDGSYASVSFLEQDVCNELPEFSGDVALFDVLHYLPPARQEALLRGVAARVAPGGMLILRDCPRDGSARYWATYVGELFAQAVSWNIGVPLHFPTRESIYDAFAAERFTREETPMYGGSPFNNRVFIFRRRA